MTFSAFHCVPSQRRGFASTLIDDQGGIPKERAFGLGALDQDVLTIRTGEVGDPVDAAPVGRACVRTRDPRHTLPDR